jgi:hypothetical protein
LAPSFITIRLLKLDDNEIMNSEDDLQPLLNRDKKAQECYAREAEWTDEPGNIIIIFTL